MPTTLYISPAGNDSTGSGTEASPWQTISKAHTAAADGDTIYCMAGTHTWTNQTFSKTLTIQGAGSATTIFDAGGPSATDIVTAKWTHGVKVTINDITFQNNGRASQGYGNAMFYTNLGIDFAEFNRCVFTGMQLNDSNSTGGINSASGIIGNSGNGAITSSFTCNSCVFYGNTLATGAIYGSIFASRNYSDTTTDMTGVCNNCTFYFGGTGSINCITFQVTNITLNNCIAHNDTGADVYGVRYKTTIAFNNCDLYQITDLHPAAGLGSSSSRTNCITSDPQFVDAASGDFRLRQGSPCLDAGTLV